MCIDKDEFCRIIYVEEEEETSFLKDTSHLLYYVGILF